MKTPHHEVTPRTEEFEILGRTFTACELSAMDVADLEDLLGFSIAEFAGDAAKRNRIKTLLAVIWIAIRKSGLTTEQILARQWAITMNELGQITLPQLQKLGRACSDFLSAALSDETPPESSSTPQES